MPPSSITASQSETAVPHLGRRRRPSNASPTSPPARICAMAMSLPTADTSLPPAPASSIAIGAPVAAAASDDDASIDAAADTAPPPAPPPAVVVAAAAAPPIIISPKAPTRGQRSQRQRPARGRGRRPAAAAVEQRQRRRPHHRHLDHGRRLALAFVLFLRVPLRPALRALNLGLPLVQARRDLGQAHGLAHPAEHVDEPALERRLAQPHAPLRPALHLGGKRSRQSESERERFARKKERRRTCVVPSSLSFTRNERHVHHYLPCSTSTIKQDAPSPSSKPTKQKSKTTKKTKR